jgi:hypothetical protein
MTPNSETNRLRIFFDRTSNPTYVYFIANIQPTYNGTNWYGAAKFQRGYTTTVAIPYPFKNIFNLNPYAYSYNTLFFGANPQYSDDVFKSMEIVVL